MIKKAFLFLCIPLLLVACDIKTKGGADLAGEAGQILVVINDEYKNADVSVKITEILDQYQIGLTQDEAPFDILLISRNHFSSVFRSHRNILFLDIDKQTSPPTIQFKKDLWTKGQFYVGLTAKNTEELLAALQTKHSDILDFYIRAEVDRYIETFKQFANTPIMHTIKDTFKFTVTLPESYSLNKVTKDFLWASVETKDFSQGFLIYQQPYTDTSLLEQKNIIAFRDSVLKKYIPGPSEGSYMATEKRIESIFKVGKYINKSYTSVLRGLWRVENDFMGGPFVAYTFVNPKTQKIITIEGYVYYPNKSKRALMRQLEAICLSAQINPE